MMIHYTMELVNAIRPLLWDRGSMSNYIINKNCKHAINKFQLKKKFEKTYIHIMNDSRFQLMYVFEMNQHTMHSLKRMLLK